MPQLDGLAETLSRISKLRLPVKGEEEVDGEEGQAGAQSNADASSAAASVRSYPPPPDSAGARLAALAAGAAASKADRWSLPVHVQAHSTLALQHMDQVPRDAGEGPCMMRVRA